MFGSNSTEWLRCVIHVATMPTTPPTERATPVSSEAASIESSNTFTAEAQRARSYQKVDWRRV